MKKFLPTEIANTEVTLKGLQACVIDDLLRTMARLDPARTHHDGTDRLDAMILPIQVTALAESLVASMGSGWCENCIMQTYMEEGKPVVRFVDVSDANMDTLCALWQLYKLEKLAQE